MAATSFKVVDFVLFLFVNNYTRIKKSIKTRGLFTIFVPVSTIIGNKFENDHIFAL